MNPLDPENFDLIRDYIRWPIQYPSVLPDPSTVYIVHIYNSQRGIYVSSSTMPYGTVTGDYILGANGVRTRNLDELLAQFARVDRTQTIWLVVARYRQTRLVLPANTYMLRIDPINYASLGAEMASISGNAVAQSVQINSVAWIAGLRIGDIIFRIGEIILNSFNPVAQFNLLRRALGSLPYDVCVIRKSATGGQGPPPSSSGNSSASTSVQNEVRSVSVEEEQQEQEQQEEAEEGVDEDGENVEEQAEDGSELPSKYQNEEGDASAGSPLAAWMTQSPLDRTAGKEKTIARTSMTGQRRQALESAYSSRSIEPNRNRKGPRPMEVSTESDRVTFSFTQEHEPATLQETSFALPNTNDADAIPGDNATFSACVQDEMDDGIRRAKKERRRTRRVDEKEDATETRGHTDSEHDDGMSAVFEDVLRPKPKKKTTQLVGMLWNPEKPRPMPRRLCKGLQSLTADWYQIGGPSSSGNGQKSDE